MLTFFSPLFAFSVVVQLRTVSHVHRILSRIMCSIQAQHFVPLLYSTASMSRKLENCLHFTFRDGLLSSEPWLVDYFTQHWVIKTYYLITSEAKKPKGCQIDVALAILRSKTSNSTFSIGTTSSNALLG